jgi:hypothetical protein
MPIETGEIGPKRRGVAVITLEFLRQAGSIHQLGPNSSEVQR